MSESPAQYRVSTQRLLSKHALQRRACCAAFSDRRYRPPTTHEIESLLSITGWSQWEAAGIMGISASDKGSATLRRWKCDPESPSYREIPYSAWRVALLEAGIVEPINTLFADLRT